MSLPYSFGFQRVGMTCAATVNGEEITVALTVEEAIMNDPDAWQMLLNRVRGQLIDEILKKYPPKVTLHR